MKRIFLATLLALALASPAWAQIASVGSLGTANSISSNRSSLVLTVSNTLEVGEIGILLYAADSDNETDGVTTEVSSVTDSAGNTWEKLGELNHQHATFDAAVVNSVWMTKATGELAGGSGTITVNHTNTHDAGVITAWNFTVAAGKTLQAVGTTQTQGADSADAEALSFSELTNKEYLFFRACAESGRANVFTATSNYTAITKVVANTGAGGTSRSGKGEFRIVTATGETSDPTSNTEIRADQFFALEEVVDVATPSSCGGGLATLGVGC